MSQIKTISYLIFLKNPRLKSKRGPSDKIVMKVLFWALLFVSTLVTGCSIKTSIEDLNPMRPSKSTDNPYGIKISGGSRQQMNGSNVDLDVSIGFRDRLVEGTNVDVQMTISGHRPD